MATNKELLDSIQKAAQELKDKAYIDMDRTDLELQEIDQQLWEILKSYQ